MHSHSPSLPDPDPYSAAQSCKQEAAAPAAPPASPALEPAVALPLEPLETPVLLPFEPVDTPVVLPLDIPAPLPLEPLETPMVLPLDPLEVPLAAPRASPLELGVALPAHPAAMAAQVAGTDAARMRRKVRTRAMCFTGTSGVHGAAGKTEQSACRSVNLGCGLFPAPRYRQACPATAQHGT
jgi:hypothetical protein